MLWAAWASTESLWLDELHTSWAVSGTWVEVASRARQGNQSPLFFLPLFGLTKTLGNLGGVPGELVLRLPSIVCWGMTLVVCLREVGRMQRDWVAAIAIFLWLMLDRIQLFYATEARVYATVQLVSLLGWIAVGRSVGLVPPQVAGTARDKSHATHVAGTARDKSHTTHVAGTARDKSHATCIWLWCGLSILLVFLHITAVLAVGWQIFCGTWLIVRRAPQQRVVWCVASSVVIIAVGIALLGSAQVWEHRQQWASFAGEASLASLLGLFPLAAYVVPVAVARCMDALWGRSGTRTEFRQPRKSTTHARLWCVAAAGPWLSAWCITAIGIAPIFHRRFVIVAAIPLIMWAAVELSRVRRPVLRWSALVAVAAWLVVSQGTLDNWRAGQLFGWQRTEGWRQTSHFLSERMQAGDQLWCASGLIEGRGAELPLSEALDRYLSFPLRGVYRVVDKRGESIEPRALVGDGTNWAVQLRAAGRASSSGSVVWIVYRGSPAGFEKQLRKLALQFKAGSIDHWQVGAPRAFGLVSIVRVMRD